MDPVRLFSLFTILCNTSTEPVDQYHQIARLVFAQVIFSTTTKSSMMSTKTSTKTSAKWSDEVFEEFVASGMKLADLLDEDIDPKDFSWHQMRRLCTVYDVRTGGTKEDMATRLRIARDEAITAPVLRSAEETTQLATAAKQVAASDAEEAAATAADDSNAGEQPKQSHAEHQQEIIDLDSKIDQLKQDFAREIEEKLGSLTSPTDDLKGLTEKKRDEGYIGFYNRKQDLRSWCTDGHPDEDRFRQNGWNPVYYATSKDDILQWVVARVKSTASSNPESTGGTTDLGSNNDPEAIIDGTPANQEISQPPPGRARLSAASQAKRSWGNALDKLKETARQLGMDSSAKDPTRRALNFDEEHWTWMMPNHVHFTIVYRTWIGTTSDLHPTVHVRYTSGSTDARPVHVLLVYVMNFFTL